MRTPASTPLWIIATVAVGFVLYWFRDVLTPFALALMLWAVIDSAAMALRDRLRGIPAWAALSLAAFAVLGTIALVFVTVGASLGGFIEDVGIYQARLETLAARAQHWLGVGGAPWTLKSVLAQVSPAAVLGAIYSALQSLGGSTVLILIYLAFLFSAAAAFSRKLPEMLPKPEERARAQEILETIRDSVQRYLVVQTIISAIITLASYATLRVIGLDNALFWAFVIFFLNYIPTIGSIGAVGLPTLFALVQFPDWQPVLAVGLGLHVWQFGIGNFVQPRMMGRSLNLSALVVLLSLAVWGSLWGIVGVFLAAPLTVTLMTVLAQFRSTYWIAVLLSANGRPLARHGAPAIPAG